MSYGAVTTAAGSEMRLIGIRSSDGRVTGFEYLASNLSRINWPNFHLSRFVYENAAFPWALTGVFGEDGVRRSTYTYDSSGRAVRTERAVGVDAFQVGYRTAPSIVVEDLDRGAEVVRSLTWSAPEGATVVNPLGAASSMTAVSIRGVPRLAGQSQSAGSGCAASSSALAHDANGNIASRDDFNGNRTCMAYDMSRNLEATRVEGLANTASCAAITPPGAALPAGSRKVSTQWHPDWSLPTKVAGAGKITTFVYNGQPDPFGGLGIATCAPAEALLPSGQPIAVLCKQVEQPTTDANGAAGFDAALQPGEPARERRWIYNAFGQVLIAKGPRTDVDDTTRYSYFADTAFAGGDPLATGHTLGDLQSVTDATGQLTTYTQYNKAGKPLEMVDANGIATRYAYDLRQRLTQVSVAGQTTLYDYWPTGLLKRITQPDASFVSYTYDAAQRLTAVQDSSGSRIEYTLDNAGNRVGETVRDATGALRRQLKRVMDALGRVELTVLGAAP